MSKWRPTELNCIYAISSIHGELGPLRLICNRILPLRKSDGGYDQLVMLGNYIGEGRNSYGVLDFLIEAKKKNKDRLILLKGEQEERLIKALELEEDKDYDYWISYGGRKLAMEYMKKSKLGTDNPYHMPRERLKSIVPRKHVDFLYSLKSQHEILQGSDSYLFTAGKTDSCVNVYGFNPDKKEPHFTGTSISLDAGSPKKIFAIELNSMEGFIAKPKKKRMIKHDIQED